MVVGPWSALGLVGLRGLQSVVTLMYGKPVAEVGVAETPASHPVVPRLIATSDIVVGQLFHCFKRVETAAVDRYKHKHQQRRNDTRQLPTGAKLQRAPRVENRLKVNGECNFFRCFLSAELDINTRDNLNHYYQMINTFC